MLHEIDEALGGVLFIDEAYQLAVKKEKTHLTMKR